MQTIIAYFFTKNAFHEGWSFCYYNIMIILIFFGFLTILHLKFVQGVKSTIYFLLLVFENF